MNRLKIVFLATVFSAIIFSIFVSCSPKVDTRQFPVEINYDLSLPEMIAAAKFDKVDSMITAKNFPVEGKGKVNVDLAIIYLPQGGLIDYVLQYLDQMGYRPATLPELLAFTGKYPDMQKKYLIAALGSISMEPHGIRMVPCLAGLGSWFNRGLGVKSVLMTFHLGDRYLAVKKSSPTKIASMTKFSANNNSPVDSSAGFTAEVNYNESMYEMETAGKYDYMYYGDDPFMMFRERPKVSGKGSVKVEFTLVGFDNTISIDSAAALLDKEGLRIAMIDELSAFGTKYPEEQAKFTIVSLTRIGSIGFGNELVTCLFTGDRGRELDYAYPHTYWFPSNCRFLAVGKTIQK